ncbi:hypothetical protein AGABI2DRAFT_122041 [Agaricus bisporus var. bisporus H97]|uniref:hypothetical protein n=1 Tax=Agaricus bisporus var. bisporus (strain H97 / ATCC MYA-4626 / FGSC 10389) TaxID=936046 RepID=UPI00029F54FA|nr:hypothetical protein AGABI2DRAFT_122041 [Agaricus bisporus var. bisporus H97]EKV43125.1 hypothetical protein AGABI2DRAFT_122041 [Agaricus bisporus var. bisporus H97]
MDASFTSARLQTEIIIRHLNDSIAPTVFETENASGFCKKALGHALFDIRTCMESWTILQGQNQKAPNGTKELHKKCVSIIIDGLRELTGKDDTVHLVGWPPHVPFANPSTISTKHLQRLSDALQAFEYAQNAFGTVARTGRKTRSDKDKKRALNTGGQGPAKRCKAKEVSGAEGAPKSVRVTKQMPPHSAEFVDSDIDSHFEQDATADPVDANPATTTPSSTAPAPAIFVA